MDNPTNTIPPESIHPDLVTIPDYERAHSQPRKKQWCFTLFYREEGVDVRFPDELPSSCTYLVCQRESCPDTGRTHVQGFVSFSLAVRFTRARELLVTLFHAERPPHMAYIRGSVNDNVVYCTKTESRLPGTVPLELGERPTDRGRPEKGKATKLARELILARKSAIEVLMEEESQDAWGIALRSSKAWDSLVAQLSPHRDRMVSPTVIVYYGPSRVGKTRQAVDLYPSAYLKPSGKWWPYYKGQEEVIYDDFDGCDMMFSEFKTVFDRYQHYVEPKGAEAKLAATTHVITTNVWPSHWYTKRVTGQYGRDAIWGRITEIWDFHSKPPTVYSGVDQVESFRKLPSNWALEDADPKARPE